MQNGQVCVYGTCAAITAWQPVAARTARASPADWIPPGEQTHRMRSVPAVSSFGAGFGQARAQTPND